MKRTAQSKIRIPDAKLLRQMTAATRATSHATGAAKLAAFQHYVEALQCFTAQMLNDLDVGARRARTRKSNPPSAS